MNSMTQFGTTEEMASVTLDRIVTSKDFRLRWPVQKQPEEATGKDRAAWLDQAHKARLMVALEGGKPFREPLLVWADPSRSDGKLVLLDGMHRLAAYRAVEWPHEIAVKVVEGDRRAALKASIQARAVVILGTHAEERADMAWRMVREDVQPRYRLREITEATGISERTAKTMRARLKEIVASAGEITGHWWQDRRQPRQQSDEDDAEAWKAKLSQMNEEEQQLIGEFRDNMDRRKRPDMLVLYEKLRVGEAFIAAYGHKDFEGLLEWLGYVKAEGPPEDDWQELSEGGTVDEAMQRTRAKRLADGADCDDDYPGF